MLQFYLDGKLPKLLSEVASVKNETKRSEKRAGDFFLSIHALFYIKRQCIVNNPRWFHFRYSIIPIVELTVVKQ